MTTRSSEKSLRKSLRPVGLLLALGLLATACGASTVTSTSSSADTESTGDTAPETSEAAPGSSAEASGGESAWEGEEAELFAADGDKLNVVGVRFDDTLNLRSGPGSEHEILTSVAPTGTVVATGRAWQVPNGFWYEVGAGGETGWANISFLAYAGPVDDATAEIKSSGGPYTAETVQDLALLVAETQASDDVKSKITIVSEPRVGDLTEILVDVIGLADDAAGGYRLQIFAEFSENGEGVDLRTAERTTLCTRGLSEGLCS